MEKTENKNENKIENKNESENKNKKIFLLRVFVLSFTILILLAWILNLKSRLKNAEDLSFAPRDENYQEFKDSLDETLKGVESGFDKVKENTKEVIEDKLDEETLDGSGEDLDNSLVVPELEDSYSIPENLENNQDGSANNNEEIYLPIIKESSCPEYVNCMPTIGGSARACNIPPGCENITQIVW